MKITAVTTDAQEFERVFEMCSEENLGAGLFTASGNGLHALGVMLPEGDTRLVLVACEVANLRAWTVRVTD